MNPPTPEPAIGQTWIRRAYVSVGWPRGRVAITDIVTVDGKGTTITFEVLAGTQAQKRFKLGLGAFLARHVYRASDAGEVQPALPAGNELYVGEEEEPVK